MFRRSNNLTVSELVGIEIHELGEGLAVSLFGSAY